MPIKKDASGKRWVEMELLVPGTPEEVWQAIATGPGYSAWFTKTEIDEHVGGAIRFDGISTGEVTTWEPPYHFAYVERDWSEGAPPLATEIIVTSRSGDRCMIRMVHSLFASTDDWDDQMEGFESGWPGFFAVLRIYLRDFAGKRAALLPVMKSTDRPHLEAWKQLVETLGLSAANVGEERSTPQQPERLTGIVEHVHQDDRQRYILMRLTSPYAGAALVGSYGTDRGTNLSLAIHLYGEDAEKQAAAGGAKWQTWIDGIFQDAQA